MDDSSLYTGIDTDSSQGVFNNEIEDEEVKKTIEDQEKLIRELTPTINNLIQIINSEIKQVMSIDRFITAAKDNKEAINSELQAAALYKAYLETLKTKFILAIKEAERTKK